MDAVASERRKRAVYMDMKRIRLRGSYTVEAAFVMAVVLWAIMVSIQAAYCLRDETAGAMALQEAVLQLSHGEDMEPEEAAARGMERAGQPFSWEDYEFQMKVRGNVLTGRKIEAIGRGGSWKLELEQKVFDPENFLRMISLLDQEE